MSTTTGRLSCSILWCFVPQRYSRHERQHVSRPVRTTRPGGSDEMLHAHRELLGFDPQITPSGPSAWYRIVVELPLHSSNPKTPYNRLLSSRMHKYLCLVKDYLHTIVANAAERYYNSPQVILLWIVLLQMKTYGLAAPLYLDHRIGSRRISSIYRAGRHRCRSCSGWTLDQHLPPQVINCPGWADGKSSCNRLSF